MKKKPISLQPHAARMQQRVQQARALPEAEQQEFYYCGGLNKTEFTAAVASGEPDALTLALNVVAGELWLCPRDGARYARSIRAALRAACETGLLDDAQKRVMYAIEMRNLERLVLRGRHSVPGILQQRSERRIPGQLQLMQRCFGEVPDLQLKTDDCPDVKPPRELLQKAVLYGWFSAEAASCMAAAEERILANLLHGPEDVFSPKLKCETMPDHAPDTLCYFLCWQGRWIVAPWGELGSECGFILAADASFCCNIDEYGSIYGACR